ncbi:MAG: hypothetical protein ACKV0T_09035 [Planctomycetales bacterium]
MRRIVPFALLAVALATVGVVSVVRAADEKPKYTIKEVMKLHKDKVHEKFQKGEASKEEAKKLLDGYEAMTKDKPPKGDAENWKKLTEALLKAAKEVDAKKDGGVDAYKKAVQCGGCHSAHKG